jgi:hypothetical protein
MKYILLVVKLAKLRITRLRNAFYPKFNIYAFTKSSIYKGVVLIITLLTREADYSRIYSKRVVKSKR